MNRNFNIKGFTSLFLFLVILIELVSSIILYVAPPGRVANWINWTMLGISKTDWQAIHTVFGYFMLIAIILHLYYNWKVLINYIVSKAKKAVNLKAEIAAALLLSAVLWFSSLYHIPPIYLIMDLGEYAKNSWESKDAKAPVSHAELLTITQIAALVKNSPDEAIKKLNDAGIAVTDPNVIMGDLAQKHNKTPNDLYAIMAKGSAKPAETYSEGSGYGKKTFAILAREFDLPLDVVMKRLKDGGIEARDNDRLKETADRSGKTTTEIIGIIKDAKK